MDVQPTEDRIYVERGEPWVDAPGLPEAFEVVQDKPPLETGTVMAVGPGRVVVRKGREPFRVPMPVKVGDRVLFDRYAGEDHDDEHVFLTVDEVKGVIEGDAKA